MSIDWDKASAELIKPLSSDAVKPPPRGKYGEYVEALHVIQEANRIFGFGGWSYTVTRLEQVSSITTKDGQYRCGWMCTVRADVQGVYREGAAVGNGAGKPDNIADVIESAVKEAETDALKRALRSFGNTFGLALYEKDKSKREVERRLSLRELIEAADTQEQINNLIGQCKAAGNMAKSDLNKKAKSIGLEYNKQTGMFEPVKPADLAGEIPY